MIQKNTISAIEIGLDSILFNNINQFQNLDKF